MIVLLIILLILLWYFTRKRVFLFAIPIILAAAFYVMNELKPDNQDLDISEERKVLEQQFDNKIPYDSMRHHTYRVDSFQASLKDTLPQILDFPAVWVSLDMDSAGRFFIYDHRGLRGYRLRSDSVISFGFMENINWRVSNYSNPSTGVLQMKLEADGEIWARKTMRLLEADTMLAHFSGEVFKTTSDTTILLGRSSMIAVPMVKSYLLRHISEPNTNGPFSFLKHYPINVDSIVAVYKARN